MIHGFSRIGWCALFATAILFGSSCHTNKKTTAYTGEEMAEETMDLPAILVRPMPYQPSEKRINDLIHTNLKIRFDWSNQWAIGEADLTLKPYFYPTSTLDLDAKGFDIQSVEMIQVNATPQMAASLEYTYDTAQIHINLGHEFQRTDTYTLRIRYTAKPNEGASGGSEAITDDKGLYFINPDGSDKKKPRQIWTQGETESNSRWFPTIDAPNEKMTQEFHITVDSSFKTVSNGTLMYQTENGDGTRTDVWKQDLPHAPYLAMIAVGHFSETKDKWRDKEVNYYVDPEYGKYAQQIFGNTPEMIEFYSKKLGVDYAWDKYSQLAVHDYVSGAMENTTAVIHGDFVQKTARELIDRNDEDVISHELFHHWFGDLVTCESWSNLPLNESFATYGEYLWFEHKYGREAADIHLNDDLGQYLQESRFKQEDLIRYRYSDREDMFDGHSYQKGGRVLHMLRKYVGDEAFFESLHRYLEKYRFKTAEIHDLRLVFEEVTGEDLNWFFNQWFLDKGHPSILIEYAYNSTKKQLTVKLSQTRNTDSSFIYKLPMRVDIYVNGNVEHHDIVFRQSMQNFDFNVDSKPDLVNVDAEKMLLCEKRDTKLDEQWRFQYRKAPLVMDRLEAVEAIIETQSDENKALLIEALSDTQPDIVNTALDGLEMYEVGDSLDIRQQLITLSGKQDSYLRAAGIRSIGTFHADDSSLKDIVTKGLADSSYRVISASLRTACAMDSMNCDKYTRQFEDGTNTTILLTIANLLARYGVPDKNNFFDAIYPQLSGFDRYDFYDSYGVYLSKQPDKVVDKGMQRLFTGATEENHWQIRYAAVQGILQLWIRYYVIEKKLKMEMKESVRMGGENARDTFVGRELQLAKDRKDRLHQMLEDIASGEENEILANYVKRELASINELSSSGE
ncbi:MAG: M1 family peptidase [Flavobacteriales bacterium]|nr:M1 family peptidase [Flavobacteriales bacterium]